MVVGAAGVPLDWWERDCVFNKKIATLRGQIKDLLRLRLCWTTTRRDRR